MKSPSFLERYQAGEHVPIWQDLVALGPSVRSPAYFHDAYAVATETMRRVRVNIETIHHNLIRIGYQFANPDDAFCPPPLDIAQQIADVEHWVGSLPLSLHAFYVHVGSINFMQSPAQLVHYYHPDRSFVSDVQMLGEEDPLVVDPFSDLHSAAQSQPERLYFCFAPDEFHKADYSGGENYHVTVPNRDADFRIEGMYDIDEWFVTYLRESLRYGGFRGKVETFPKDDQLCHKSAPRLHIIEELTQGLVPM
jgi:hypothetical protein